MALVVKTDLDVKSFIGLKPGDKFIRLNDIRNRHGPFVFEKTEPDGKTNCHSALPLIGDECFTENILDGELVILVR